MGRQRKREMYVICIVIQDRVIGELGVSIYTMSRERQSEKAYIIMIRVGGRKEKRNNNNNRRKQFNTNILCNHIILSNLLKANCFV